jgi:vacuolar-type H+-ATPase subunit E/Vma4
MTEELKDLIEKIQQEGVKAAEDKARVIEEEAEARAKAIIEEAKKEAQVLLLEAKDKASKMEEATRASLKQVGRDLVLSLKTEINDMLNRIITTHVREALSIGELAQILGRLIKETGVNEKAEVIVALKKEDAQVLEKGFLAELKKQAEHGIKLAVSDDIRGGFTISFDSGKSFFDFTDKAFAEYISLTLKPRLAEILMEPPKK